MGEKKKPAATAPSKAARVVPPEKDKGGRPPLEWNEKIYTQVEAMLGFGLNIPQAAAVVGMSEGTLKRRLKEEQERRGFDPLILARAKVIGQLGQSAYQQAIGYERVTDWAMHPKTGELVAKRKEWIPPNAKMAQFLLNVLGQGKQFVPKKILEVSGEDGSPIEVSLVDYRGKERPKE